jgi:Ca2+-binding RTX toxin-like protein
MRLPTFRFWHRFWQWLVDRKGRTRRRRPIAASPLSPEQLGDCLGALPRRRAPLPSVEILESRVAPAVTASVVSNVLTVLGDGGSNTIKISLNTDTSKLDVFDNNSAVTGSPFTISSFTSVSVQAGGNNDTIELSDLTSNPTMAGMTITLDGQAGNDKYEFFDNWGTVVIAENGGELGFYGPPTQFTGALTLNAPSNTPGSHEIVGDNGGVLSTIDYDAAASFTTDIGNISDLGNLRAGLTAVADLGDRIDVYDKLAQSLSLLDGRSLGQLIDVGGVLKAKLVDSLASLQDPVSLSQILAAFNATSGVTATGSRNAAGDTTINLTLDVQTVLSNIFLSLPDELSKLHVDALGGDLSTRLQWSLQIDQDASGDFTATSMSNLVLSADLDKKNFDGRAGFLGLHFATPSTVFLNADVTVNTGNISGETTAQLDGLLASDLTQSGTALAKVDLTGGTTVGGVSITFPSLPAPTISLTGTSAESTFDLFVAGATRNYSDNFTAAGLDDFYLTNAGNVQAQLKSFADFLDLFGSAGLFTALPLSADGTSLADVLQLKNQFTTNFLNLLERPPLTTGTLVSTLNGGRGVRTAAGDDIQITLSNNTTFSVELNSSATSATLAAGTTMANLISRINTKAWGISGVNSTNFEARIDPRTGGLAIVDRTGSSAATFVITALNGSLAGADLDLLSPGSVQFDENTLARDLNNGVGVRTAGGNDIRILLADGTTFDVDLNHSANATIDDLIKMIRDASPDLTNQQLEITLDKTNRRLILTDKTSGSSTFAVTALNSSFALTDLKINAASGGIGAPKIIAQNINYPGPNFGSIQEMAAKAGGQITSLSYSNVTHRLTFNADVNVGQVDSTTLALFGAGPLQNLVITNGPVNVSLTPSGTTKLHLPFEILLTSIGAGFNLGSGTTSSTLLKDLNRGLGVRTVTGNDFHVQLSDNTKSFDVDLNNDISGILLSSLALTTAGGNDITVTLRDGSTFGLDLDPIGTKTIGDLVTALNAAAETAFGEGQEKFLARVDIGRGSLILIDRTTGTADYQVTAPVNLGLGAATDAYLDSELEHFVEASFRTLGDVMAQIQQAATNAGLTSEQFEVRIAPDGKGLRIIDGTNGTGEFIISQLNDSTAWRDLGLATDGIAQPLDSSTLLSELNRGDGVGTVGGNDVRITLRDGSTFDVNLSAAQTTIGDVLSAIQAAADAAFGANQTKFKTGTDGATSKPSLFDLTTGGSTFAVTALNSSDARADLGLTANGVNGNMKDGTAVQVISITSKTQFIEGVSLHGDTSSAHFGVRNATLTSTVNLAASGINAVGTYGPAAVAITGGSASGAYNFNMTFADIGSDAADGMASLRELRRGLPTPDSLMTGVTRNGTLNLNLPLTIAPPFGGLTNTAPFVINVANVVDTATAPALSFTGSNATINFLNKVATLTMADAFAALQDTADYLKSLETRITVGGQTNPLAQLVPGVNRSVGQILEFGARFDALLATLETNPPTTLQGLQAALDALAGISGVTLGFDSTAGNEALQFNFTYSLAQILQQRFQLNLPGTQASLAALGLSTASMILDADKVSPVNINAAGTINIGLGVNLTSNHDGFLYGPSTSASMTLRAIQNDLNFEALFGARTVSVIGGTYVFDFDGNGASTTPAAYSVTMSAGRHDFADAITDTTATLTGEIDAHLPVHYAAEFNQPLDSAINLAIDYTPAAVTPTLTTTGPNIDNTLNSRPLNGNIQGIRAGFKELFRLLDLAFDAQVFAKPLPFVGNQLISAADFLEQMRDKVGDNFDFITGIMTPVKAQQAIFDAFGPGGLNWLQDRTNDSDNLVNIHDIVISNNANAVEFTMTLTMAPQSLDVPIDVDFALPGLGLKVNALANVQFGFSMPLTFGISTSQGVYVNKSSFDNLTATLTASLPTVPASLDGWLGSMPYTITQQGAATQLVGNYDVTVIDPNSDGKLSLNELSAVLGAAIRPTDASTQTAAATLMSGGFTSTSNGIHLHLTSALPEGAAVPRYQMDLDISNWNYTDSVSSTPTIAFDHVQFELVSFMRDFVGSALTRLRNAFRPVDGVVDFMNNESFPFISLVFGRAPYVSANTFDGGKVEVGNFAGASLAIRRIVEGGQLVGQASNPFGIFGVVPFDLLPPSPVLLTPEWFDWMELLGVGAMKDWAGTQWINLGDPNLTDFTIDGAAALQPLPAGQVSLVPQNTHTRPYGNPDDANGVSILGDIRAIAGDVNVAAGVQDAALSFLAVNLLPGRGKVEGFFGGGIRFLMGVGIDPVQLPILTDASKSFSLVFGDYRLGNPSAQAKDVELLKYGTPEMFLYLYQDIPISKEQLAKKILKEGTILGALTEFGVRVEAFIPVAFETRADFGVAIDGFGLKTYGQTRNTFDLANGFYFDDRQGIEKNGPNTAKVTGSNSDPDEMKMVGGAGIGVQIIFDLSIVQIKIGVEAIAFIGSAWNLHDPDNSDGQNRVRANEFDVNMGSSWFDQSFVIEFRADVFAKLSVGISIFRVTIIDIRFNLGTTTFDIPFSQHFNPLISLGTMANGQLTLDLSVGAQLNKVFYIGAGDNDGDIVVSTRITTPSFYFFGFTFNGWTYTRTQLFTGVTSITGTAGMGDDEIYVSSAVTKPVTLQGGAGNDTIVGGSGNDSISGGADNDVIAGGAGNDTLHGNDDNDTIQGNDGNDTIQGDAGTDRLFGDRGDDAIYGGIGIGFLFGGVGADLLVGDTGVDTIQGGPGRDRIRGGRGRDLLHGDDGADTIDGEEDEDEIHGGLGNDVINGNAADDSIYGEQNNDTITGGIGNDRLDGGGATDRVFGDNGPPNPEPSGDDLIVALQGNDFIDGQGGNDTYILDFEGGVANSLVTVLDTGSNEGTDLFTVNGTVFADNILLRSNAAGSLSFVALVNSSTAVERINYTGVERIVINGGLGNDYVAVDDTTAEITINGEGGADTFQIGQLFASQRTNVDANVSVDDEFATIETTRGFLSNGNSRPMTINGGNDDDHFVVFHNKAVLSLNGDAGDDFFEVRAFALVGSQEPQRARTDISGGAGADLVQYAVNAPVNVDGGDGFDTVVAIGTEFGDDFVITKDGVFGGGLNVSYVNIESLRVDGAEGNDRFYVQSTSEQVATELLGGLGNDTFNMSGDAPPVVSNDLRGHTGIVTHDVESLDPLFDGMALYGIASHVADNDEPGVVIQPSGGSTIITEGGVFDSYQVVLTRMPTVTIIVKALAPLPTPDERERRARAFSISSNAPGALNAPNGTFVSLKFTPANWFIPQTVLVKADSTLYSDPAGLLTRPELGDASSFTFDDAAFEGLRFGVINHLILADLPSYNGVLSKSQLASVTGATEAVIQVTGAAATGNQFNLVVGANPTLSFTVGADTSHGAILDGLKAAFDAEKASQGAGGALELVNALRMAQRTITLSGSVDAGDQFTATFGTQVITYTVPDTGVSTLAQAAAGMAIAINAANLTGVTADSRANDGTILVRTPAATSFAVGEATDPGNNSAIALSTATQLLIVDAEDGDLSTDDSTNFSVSTNAGGAGIVINVDGASGATTQFSDGKDLSNALIGRKIEVTSGPGAGQQRFVVAINGSVVTVDRPWNIDDVPTFQSTYLIRQDDAIVGTPTAVDNSSFTFTDNATQFPDAGEGLRGRVLKIVGGPGAGQERLILSNDEHVLTLNGSWRTAPTSASIYRIDMFDGLAVPSVRVQVNDNDKPGIIVDETMGYNSGVVNDIDTVTAVIEGGNGDHLGEQDVVRVRLTTNPGATPVDVTLNYDNTQLNLTDLSGNPIANGKLVFNSSNWNSFQTVRVAAVNDILREGFHSSLIRFNITAGSGNTTSSTFSETFTIPADRPTNIIGLSHLPSAGITMTLNGNNVPAISSNPTGVGYELVGNKVLFRQGTDYANVSGTIVVSYTYVIEGFVGALTPSVLVRMSDDDAPTVLVRETGGSTDVIESGALSNLVLERLPLGWYTGSISALAERDPYTVLLIAGKTYTFELRGAPTSEGTLPDPYLRLFRDSDLVTPVAQNDDDGIGLDSLLIYTPTDSGYYVLQAGAWNDGSTGSYVLTMLPGYTTGAISTNGERDSYRLSLIGGRQYTFEMLGTPTGDGTLTDPYLRIYNSTAPTTLLGADDDFGVGYNSRLVFTPSADGLYILEAAGFADARTGTYTISWTDTASSLSQAIMQELQNANDSYEVVLTKAPAAGQEVTVIVTPEITKTTRTGGIRHDAVQVAISSTDDRVEAISGGRLSVTFDDTNWDTPVIINVAAIDDAFVDGGDTKVFAPGPHAVSNILGPVTVDGGGGQGSLVGIPAPVKLAGETNVKPKTGDVVSVTGTQVDVLLADLTAAFGAAPLSDLLGKTMQVTGVTPATNTTHSAIGQFRQIINAVDNGDGSVTLTLNQTFDFNLNGNTGETDADIRSYAITQESPNFFVNEATQVDFMFVHDEDSPADSTGTLTATRLSGLNMGPDITIGGQRYVAGGITYGNLEVLQIDLGKGFNNFSVLGTGTRTDGYQTWTIINTGDDILDPNSPATRVGDTVTVKLNATSVAQSIRTVTSATDATPTAFATLVDSGASFPTAGGGLAGQLVEIVSGPGVGQVRRILSNTATTLYLDAKWGSVPTSSSTYQITKRADGKLAVNLQGGNDVLDASASTLGIVVFGGLGTDTITGGAGDDILFGDRGRVDYFNQAGAIVTRLGDAPQPITGFVTTQVDEDTLTTLTDSEASFALPDDVVDALGNDDIGLRGLYVSINNGAGFLQKPQLITDNTLDSLTLSPGFDPSIAPPGPAGASAYRISTYPEDQTDGVVRDPGLLITVDNDLGDADVINAGAGNDQILGGAGADSLTGGNDHDLIIGDAGRVDRSRDPSALADVFTAGQPAPVVPMLRNRVRTTDSTLGGADIINGDNGDDTLIGGFGGDTIAAGAGNNLILGDDGQIDHAGADANATDIDLIESLSTTAHGGIDTITAGVGNDIVIGGRLGDSINVGDGNNLVIGDNGRITASSANTPHQLAGHALTLGLIETITFTDGGVDNITTGTGNDIVIGGMSGDTISAGAGNNLILGDDGQIDYSRADRITTPGADTDASDIDLIESLSTTAGGGVDTITTLGGDDIVIGGRFGDTLNVGDGDNLIIGDSGRITAADANTPHQLAGQSITLGLIESFEFTDGDVDGITTGAGNDIVIGGFAGDTIDVSSGHNIVLGDDGQIDYSRADRMTTPGADTDASDIDLIESLSTTAGGSVDTITTLGGDDIVIGGRADDTINVGDGDNLVIGDSGRITAADANSPHQFAGQPITLGLIESFEFTDGGVDGITTGTGNDIVIGGFAGDTIDVSSGRNIVLGDDGRIDYSRADRTTTPGADTDASDIDLIESLSTTAGGGVDTITTLGGDDIVIGGRFGDTINVGDGDNLVVGDSGRITAADANTPHQLAGQPITLGLIESFEFTDGGVDGITTGTGNDIVIGGFAGDTIDVSSGHNIVLGDDGRIDYSRADRTTTPGADTDASDIDLIESLSTTDGGGVDDITTLGGDDIVIGGRFGDTINVGDGDNLVIGDSGRITAADANTPHQLAGQSITLGLIESFEFTDGGVDGITTGTGNDIVIGGFAGDTIDVNSGDNIVLGDDGQIDFSRADRTTTPGADTDASDIDLIESLSTTAGGGVDTITTLGGDDIVIGGRFGDTINVGDGDNLVIGDSGRITAADANTPHQLAGQSITLGLIESFEFTDGGVDGITTGTGNDIVIGGFAGDTIDVSSGHNIVVGDDGQIDYSRADRTATPGADTDASDIDLIESLSTTTGGGIDTITTLGGDDIILGGRFGDTISVGDGDNLVIGDSGRITAADANTPHQLAGQSITLGLIESFEFTDGGIDGITTGTGNDIVIGGFAGDTIDVSSGHNIVLGDDGQIDFARADRGAGLGSDTDASDIDLIESLSTTVGGGVDTITTLGGNDVILGGRAGDLINAGDGDNLVLGDSGCITGDFVIGQPITFGMVETIQHDDGGIDTISTGIDNDTVLGGFAGDIITLGADDDFAVGDNGQLVYAAINSIQTTDVVTTTGGNDLIFGNDGNDVILGGVGSDIIDGQVGQDLILGDNGLLQSRAGGVLTDPHVRVLTGAKLYDGAGQVLIDRNAQFVDPDNIAAWANWVITLDAGLTGLFGNDYLAGGQNNDKIFGQRGNDTIQGDGSIDSALLATPAPVGAFRDASNLLVVMPSVEAATDGDDYIEGGGENDVVFGNLGQDDIIGGNSNQHGLTLHSQRGDGADLLFGGAGLDLARNDAGDTSSTGHARDADAIIGDNGNIFRIVGSNGANSGDFLAFTYDNYNGGTGTANKVIPRAIELIDYTPGSDVTGLFNDDLGGDDEIHGESGDDFIYGQKGSDVLFGEGQDDDLIGGRGADWIAAGTGNDGVLGDDGRLFTSRNGQTESLNGIAAIPANQLNLILSTSSRQNEATINISGQLKKTADLEPFAFGGNDIVYGGLGNDAIHAGAGDDAVSGAEALSNFYVAPANNGNVLRFGAVRAGEFAAYNYLNPRQKIANFLLNFEANVGGAKVNDGKDILFGDDGNDWMVGGTNADHLYGGIGNDLLNNDDNLDTDGGLNNTNELGVYGDADLAYGGGGKDVLIANVTLDRLIDWNLNATVFIVPFNNVTAPMVTTTIEASLYTFLYGVSKSDGVDMTRPGNAARNGEPNGELGLFIPADLSYGSQTALPANGTSTLNNPVTYTNLGGVSATDTAVQAEIAVGAGQQAGLIARIQSNGHYYLGMIRSVGAGFVAEIYRFDGVLRLLASTSVSTGTGVLRFELIGSFLRLLYGPNASSLTQILFTYDSVITGAGGVGIRASQSAGIDAFTTSTVTVPATQTLPFSDSFDANPPTQILSTDWLVRTGAFNVSTDALVGTGTTNFATVHGIALANTSVQADVNVAAVNYAFAGVVARVNNKGHYYTARIVRIGPSYFAQILRFNGKTAWLGSVKVTSGVGTLQFDVVGPSLKLFFGPNGAPLSLVAFAFDKTLTAAGTTGVRMSKNASLDNFVTSVVNVPATQSLPFNDAFNANPPTEQLSSDWQERQGNFTVAGNNLVGRSGINFATVNGIALANASVQANITLAVSQSAGLFARYQSNGVYYLAQLSRTATARTANIYKYVIGVGLVKINSVAGTFAGTGGLVQFEVVGSSLKLFVNGFLVAFAHDTAITAAGQVGVRSSANAALDDFAANQIVPSTPALPFTEVFGSPINGNQLSRDWQSRLGNLAVTGGTLANAPGTALSLSTVNGPAMPDTASELSFTLPSTGTSLAGVVARYQGTGDRNLYLGAIRSVNGVATAVIMKNVNGVWTTLATHSLTSNTGRLRFEVEGTALRLFVGPTSGPLTLVASAIDKSFATGLNGIRASGAGTLDDYFIDTI